MSDSPVSQAVRLNFSAEASAERPTGAEMRILICCACRHLSDDARARLRTLLCMPLDWDRLLVLATHHKMLPLLAWHLRSESTSVPPASLRQLQGAFLANSGQMLRLSGELLQICRLLAQHDVAVVPYKGPALGAYLYGNLALRQGGDLDLLVKRGDVVRARTILYERGYRPRHVLSFEAEGFMLRSRYSEEFERSGGPSVELHWTFTNGDVAVPLDLDVVGPRLQTIPFGGGTVSMFGVEDLLLILCIHGSKHRWDRLEWLCGVAEIVRAHGHEIDWDALLKWATMIGTRRMLLLGLLLVRQVFAAPVPPPLILTAKADRAVAQLSTQVRELFESTSSNGDDAPNLTTDRFRLKLRERWRDRLRFLWYRITTPSRPENWSAFSVGQRTVATHALVRPFHLVSGLFRALRAQR